MAGTRERAEELARALEHAPGTRTSAEVAALLPVTAALTATGTALAGSASAVTLPAGLASGRAAMVAAATAHHAAAAAAGAGGAAGAGSGLAAAGTKAGLVKLGILALPGWLPVVTGVAAVAVATAGVVTTTTDAGSSHRVTTVQPGSAQPLASGLTPSARHAALIPGASGAAGAVGAPGSAGAAPVPVSVPSGPAAGASLATIMADANQRLTTVAALLHADPSASAATLQKIATAIVDWRLDVAHLAAALGTTRAGIVELQTFVHEQLTMVSTLAKSLPASTVQALAPVTALLGQFSTAITTTLATVVGAASAVVGSVPGTSLITNLPLPFTLTPTKVAGVVASAPGTVASLLHPASTHPASTHPASTHPASNPAVHLTPVPVASLVPGLPTLPVKVQLPLPVKVKTSAATTAKTSTKAATKAPVVLPSVVTPSGVAGLASTVSGAVNKPVSGTVGTVTGGLGGILGH